VVATPGNNGQGDDLLVVTARNSKQLWQRPALPAFFLPQKSIS